MNVSGDKSFEAARSVVWEVLNDPARMAKLMPGIESFEIEDDRHWTAKVKVPLGLGAMPISFAFEKTEEREPEYARLSAKGKGVGAIVSMDTRFTLSESGGGTAMHWEADVSIAGPVGSMGQRVLQPIVNQQVGNVLIALQAQVEEAAGGAGSGNAAPGPASAGPAAGSEGSAQGSSGTAPGSEKTEPGSEMPAPASEESAPASEPPAARGAEEGIHPASPESYSGDPEGPTHSARAGD